MPPKFKFTREQIVFVAFSVARRDGISAVTARAVGAELCSSPKVIFSLFRDMEELKSEVVVLAKALYKEYVERGLAADIPFKGVGEEYIRFAKDEPMLFGLLFMKERTSVPALRDVLNVIDNSYEKILASVETWYGLSRETAENLYRHLWIYSHGIAALTATKTCAFSEEEIGDMLTEVCKGILMLYGSERNKSEINEK